MNGYIMIDRAGMKSKKDLTTGLIWRLSLIRGAKLSKKKAK
jgi:hypothetical protein